MRESGAARATIATIFFRGAVFWSVASANLRAEKGSAEAVFIERGAAMPRYLSTSVLNRHGGWGVSRHRCASPGLQKILYQDLVVVRFCFGQRLDFVLHVAATVTRRQIICPSRCPFDHSRMVLERRSL